MNRADFRDVHQAVNVFKEYARPWAVCGGWAIDLYLGRITRPHKDVDFAVLRLDQLAIQEHLVSQGWSLEKAVKGQLIPWQKGEWIDLPVHVIWCKHPQASPNFIELLFNEVKDERFLYRRDFSVTLPAERMIISSSSGIPILAPEIVLLYKSGKPEEDPSATADFMNVSPKLSAESRDWLASALKKSQPNHIWLKDLS